MDGSFDKTMKTAMENPMEFVKTADDATFALLVKTHTEMHANYKDVLDRRHDKAVKAFYTPALGEIALQRAILDGAIMSTQWLMAERTKLRASAEKGS